MENLKLTLVKDHVIPAHIETGNDELEARIMICTDFSIAVIWDGKIFSGQTIDEAMEKVKKELVAIEVEKQGKN